MKKILLFTFLSICVFSYGQKKIEKTIYLRNGSIVSGIVIDQKEQHIKIKTKDENVFVFNLDDIEKIEPKKRKGYFNMMEIGGSFLIHSNINDTSNINVDSELITIFNQLEKINSSFDLKMINGYHFNDHLSLGLGLGFDKYNGLILLPISIVTNVTILKGENSPVFTLNLGYAHNENEKSFKSTLKNSHEYTPNKLKHRIFINAQFGMKIPINNELFCLFNVGYKLQNQPFFIRQNDGILNKKTVSMGLVNFSTCFMF